MKKWQKLVLTIVLVLAGIVIILIVLMAIGIIPGWDILVDIFATLCGVFIILYGMWKALPDEIKHFFAKVLRKIPNLPIFFKRRTVKLELESEINAALKEFGKEGAGFMEHEVVINWLKPEERARRLFFLGGKAYIKLDFDEDKERTLVEAVLMYCNECLLPEARQYIPRPLMRAIDLTFIDELLDRRNAVRGRAYFTQEVMPRELELTPDIDKYLDDLELISQHGLFVRILLPEIRDYPGRTQRRVARRSHVEQVEAFIEFLKITAEDRTNKLKRAWLHIGETIRIGVILVGITNKLQYEGRRPYVRRAAMDNANGARNVYLIGYNLGVRYVRAIAKEAKQRGIVEEYEIHPYGAVVGGELKQQVLARLSIPEGSGKHFLEQFPNTAEWPELEDEEETNTDPIYDWAQKHPLEEALESKIDAAWSKRVVESGESIHGSVAADDAAKVLGVDKLKASEYKKLEVLLKASKQLNTKWIREGNAITRR